MPSFFVSNTVKHFTATRNNTRHSVVFALLFALFLASAGGLQAKLTVGSGKTVTRSNNENIKPGGPDTAIEIESGGHLIINNTATVTGDLSSRVVPGGQAVLNYGTVTVTEGATFRAYNNASVYAKAGFLNEGIINVINGGTLKSENRGVSQGSTNNKTINIDATSFFVIQSDQHNTSRPAYNQTNGTTNIDGTLVKEANSYTVFNGGILSGSGNINGGAITINNANVRLRPGSYNATTGTDSIGTLTFGSAQSWTSGFTLDWQRSASASDLLKINGALTISDSSSISYTLNLSTVGAATLARGTAEWNLVTATSISTFSTGNWKISDANKQAFLTAAGYSSSTGYANAELKAIQRGSNIVLALWDGVSFFYRENIGANSWNSTAASYGNIWEGSPSRTTRAGDNVYFTSRQAAATVVTLGTAATVGNLTIGNANTPYTLTGTSIAFNGNGGLSRLTHTADAAIGDTINSNLILNANALEIRLLTQNALNINGTVTGTQALNITDSGRLALNTSTNNHISVGSLSITDANVTHTRTAAGNGIYSAGSIAITDATFINNISNDAIGIRRGTGSLTIEDSTFVNTLSNNATGIYSAGDLFITDSAFTNNIDNSTGIHRTGGTATINGTTVFTQTIDTGNGILNTGGSLNLNGHATLNQTVNTGTGILNSGGAFLITGNSTINSRVQSAAASGIVQGAGGNITLGGHATINQTVVNGNGILANGAVFFTGDSKLINIVEGGNGIHAAATLTVNGNASIRHEVTSGNALFSSGAATILGAVGNSIIITGNITGADSTGIFNSGGDVSILGNATYTQNVTDNATGIRAAGVTIDGTGTFNQTLSGAASTGIIATDTVVITGSTKYTADITSGTGIDALNLTLNGSSTLNQTLHSADATGITLGAASYLAIGGDASLNQIVNAGIGIHTQGQIILGSSAGNATLNQTVVNGTGILADKADITLSGREIHLDSKVTGAAGNGIVLNDSALTIQTGASLASEAANGANGISLNNSTLSILNDGSHLYLNGVGTQLTADADSRITVQNDAHVHIATGASLQNDGTFTVENGGILYVDGTLQSSTAINMSAGSAKVSIIAGSGTIDATVNTGNTTNNRFAAGTAATTDFGDSGTVAGTLTFARDQKWDGAGFAWQMGNAHFGDSNNIHSGTGNDLFQINGDLTLNTSAQYTVYLASLEGLLSTSDIVIADDSAYYWTILSATGTITGLNLDNWSFSGIDTLLSSLNLSSKAYISFDNTIPNEIRLQLTTYDPDTYSWLSGNTTGYWTDTAWSPDSTPRANPDGAGINVRLEEDQTAHTTVTINAGITKTISSLGIGSENGTAGTTYALEGGTLEFISGNASINSSITHHGNALVGDKITSNIVINANPLLINALSANTLLLTGTITGNQLLTFTGTNGAIEHHTAAGTGIDTSEILLTNTVRFTNTAENDATGISLRDGAILSTSFSATLTNNLSDTAVGIRATDSTIHFSNTSGYNATLRDNTTGILLDNSVLSADRSFKHTANITGTATDLHAVNAGKIIFSDNSSLTHHLNGNATAIHLDGDNTLLEFGGASRYIANLDAANATAIHLNDNATLLADDQSGLTLNLNAANTTGINATLGSTITLNASSSTAPGLALNLNTADTTGIALDDSTLRVTGGSRLGIQAVAGTGIHATGTSTITVDGTSAILSTTLLGDAANPGTGIHLADTSTLTLTDTANFTQILSGANTTALHIDTGATATFAGNSVLSATITGSVEYNETTSKNDRATGIHNTGNLIFDTTAIIPTRTHTITTGNITSTDAEVDDSDPGTAVGIYNTGADATVTITGNTRLTLNNNDRLGTGIYGTDGSLLTITGNSVTDINTTGNGTGIWVADGATLHITGNAAINTNGFGSGDAIDAEAATILIDGHAHITANTHSGGDYFSNAFWASDDSNVTITGNATFINKITFGDNNVGYNNDDSLLTITGNSTVIVDVLGGRESTGFYNTGNMVIDQNRNIQFIIGSGSGIWVEAGWGGSAGHLLIQNSTITSDITGGSGIVGSATSEGAETATILIKDTTLQTTLSGGNLLENTETLILENATLTGTATDGNLIYNYGANAIATLDTATTVDNTGATIRNSENATFLNNGSITTAAIRNTLNATFHNNGTITGTLVRNSENATLHNTGIITGGNIILETGARLTGTATGNIHTTITGDSTTRLSPGAHDTNTIDTLNITTSQDWTAGMGITWQLGSLTDNSTLANDYINITGTLTLSAEADYALDLGALATGTSTQTHYAILGASLINGFDPTLWTLNNKTEFLAATGWTGQLGLTHINNQIHITAFTEFHWNTNAGTGDWADYTQWTELNPADNPGITVHLTASQAAATTVNLGGKTRTLGNLNIGSQDAAATDTTYNLSGGTLNFDNNGAASTITHHTNAQGDTISADITLSNNLTIATNSDTNDLVLTGLLAANDHNIAKTGDGNLVYTGTAHLGSGDLSITAGALHLNNGGTLSTTGQTTVASGATIGGNGTLNSNLIMAAQDSAINITGRAGAKYPDNFTVKGNLYAADAFTLSLEADLSNVHVHDGSNKARGDESSQMSTTVFASNLFLDGNLLGDPSQKYTINLTNIGNSVNITDWSWKKNGASEVGFLLFTVTGSGTFDNDKWSLGNWTDDGWELRWMDGAANGHQLWLFYANPTRIPEPTTYALLLGTLSLALLIIRRRQKK